MFFSVQMQKILTTDLRWDFISNLSHFKILNLGFYPIQLLPLYTAKQTLIKLPKNKSNKRFKNWDSFFLEKLLVSSRQIVIALQNFLNNFFLFLKQLKILKQNIYFLVTDA